MLGTLKTKDNWKIKSLLKIPKGRIIIEEGVTIINLPLNNHSFKEIEGVKYQADIILDNHVNLREYDKDYVWKKLNNTLMISGSNLTEEQILHIINSYFNHTWHFLEKY